MCRLYVLRVCVAVCGVSRVCALVYRVYQEMGLMARGRRALFLFSLVGAYAVFWTVVSVVTRWRLLQGQTLSGGSFSKLAVVLWTEILKLAVALAAVCCAAEDPDFGSDESLAAAGTLGNSLEEGLEMVDMVHQQKLLGQQADSGGSAAHAQKAGGRNSIFSSTPCRRMSLLWHHRHRSYIYAVPAAIYALQVCRRVRTAVTACCLRVLVRILSEREGVTVGVGVVHVFLGYNFIN